MFRKRSNKPILVTARDAIVVTVASCIGFLIFYIIYYICIGTPAEILSYNTLIALSKIFGLTIIYQFLYEYLGANAMIAESSLRYARGSDLDKFVSARVAALYHVANQMTTIERERADNNMKTLMLAINERAALSKMISDNATLDTINTNNAHLTAREFALLRATGPALQALPKITDKMDRDIIRDILLNGFDGYTLTSDLIPRLNPLKVRAVKLAALREMERDQRELSNDDIILQYGSVSALEKRINIIKSKYVMS